MVLYPEIGRKLIDRGKIKVYVPSEQQMDTGAPCAIKKVIFNAGASGAVVFPAQDNERIFLLLNGSSMMKSDGRKSCAFNAGDVFAPGIFANDVRFFIRNSSAIEEVEMIEILLLQPAVNKEKHHIGFLNSKSNSNGFYSLGQGGNEGGGFLDKGTVCLHRITSSNTYDIHFKRRYGYSRMYIFVLDGEIEINGTTLKFNDALLLSELELFKWTIVKKADLLIVELKSYGK